MTRCTAAAVPAAGFSPETDPDPRRSHPCRAFSEAQNRPFHRSTSSSADCRLCIKSEIGEFSRFRCGFDLANPRKQTKPPASSGLRTALLRSLELQTSGSTKIGRGEFEKAPSAPPRWAEPGRRQIPYALTLRAGLPGHRGRLRRPFFSPIGGNPQEAAKELSNFTKLCSST